MPFDYSSSFAGINNAISNIGKQNELAYQRQTLAKLGQQIQSGDYGGAAQAAFAAGDAGTGLGLLKLGQAEKDRASDASLAQGIFGGGMPSQSLGAVGRPVAALGTPNSVESSFVDAVKGAGLTNPVGLGAVAAYGKAESGYNPGNVNRSWSDPSQSGQPGMAGGIMSWRADRLQNLQRFAASRGEQGNGSPQTQALFLAQEDPTLIPKLQAAKTPEEANQIMANAWRFAGYNQPGGENARRLALTQGYAQRYGGQAGPAPAVPVQVAENEADVQRLEAQQGNPVIDAPAPVQVAQAPAADLPAPGAANTQFVIPGTNTTIDQQTLSSNPRIQNMVRALGMARTERGQAMIKQALDLEIADAKQRQAINAPTDVQRNYKAAVDQGYKGSIFDYQTDLRKAGANPKAEDAYDQTLGKANAEYFVETQKGGRDASSQLTTLKRMQSLLNDPNFYSGWNGGRATAFKKMAVSLGIKDAEAAAPNELFDKLSKQAVLDKSGGSFGTGFSNGDRDYIDATTANINNTPEGNRQIIDMGIKIAQRRVEVARMAREYASKHSGRLDSAFDDEVAAFAEKNPLFPQAAAAAKPSAPAAAPQGNPAPAQPQTAPAPTPSRPTIIINPNTGQRMMLTPNGTWGAFDG